MPVEIREIVIKANVENRAKIEVKDSNMNIINPNFELLMKQIIDKNKNRNER